MQLGNHLGNVLVTISDKKRGVADPITSSLISHFEPIMLSGTDYYPFGMAMRVGGDSSYKYGFNGQERSNEIKGEGNSYTAEFWEYDPRIGRRWNLDPRPMVGVSEYSAFNNNPILNSDPLGDTTSRPSWAEKGPIDLSKYKAGSLPYKGSILNKANAAANNWILGPIGNRVIDLIDGIGNPATTIYNIGAGIGAAGKALYKWDRENPDKIGGIISGLGSAGTFLGENYNNPDFHMQVATMGLDVFGGGLMGSKINMAENLSLKSSGSTAAGGMFRADANAGAFSSLEIPMQLRYVKKYAKEADIGLSGIKIKINRQADMVGRPYFGNAADHRTIILFPNAFQNAEQLIRTLGHERMHIWQYKTYGKGHVMDNRLLFENATDAVESSFWQFYKTKNK